MRQLFKKKDEKIELMKTLFRQKNTVKFDIDKSVNKTANFQLYKLTSAASVMFVLILRHLTIKFDWI